MDVGRRYVHVFARVEAPYLGAAPAPEEPVLVWLAVWAYNMVLQKLHILILAIEAAGPARVREDKEMVCPIRVLERRAPTCEALQALLLHDRRAPGVLTRKQDDDACARLSPVGRDEGALLDHVRDEPCRAVLGRPVPLPRQPPLQRAVPCRAPVGRHRACIVDEDLETRGRVAVEGAYLVDLARECHILKCVQQREIECHEACWQRRRDYKGA
mmetsp:Transcript_34935/g.86924  ORF Transcript_34935/g.86924 Transcript_34935/m.86924 type:complete len:214 (-) Transcript_34935:96-737(-)